MTLGYHCAITICDHMVDMLRHNIYNCTAIHDAKMHRTKCINIIRNVIKPHLLLVD